MVIKQFNKYFNKKKIIITGHNGFKGSWLSMWLKELGSDVLGVSLPDKKSHLYQLNLNIKEELFDLKNFNKTKKIFQDFNPDIIIHLAAQTIVSESYSNPYHNWNNNLISTLNVLETSKTLKKIKLLLVTTTDKVYENVEKKRGYKETDPLGGYDPYSASKASIEHMCNSYSNSIIKNKFKILTARSGNVIGGGDWSKDRLIPDISRAINSGKILKVRNPNATRPWQHVLDCLSGYLLLIEKSQYKLSFNNWNFGPNPSYKKSVKDVLLISKKKYPSLNLSQISKNKFHEFQNLSLNINRAKKFLDWKPVLSFKETIHFTLDWYSRNNNDKSISYAQLNEYFNLAQDKKMTWINYR